MTSSSTFSSRWTNSRARSSAMLDRSRSSSIGPLAPGEGGGQTATYYAHFPVSWQPVKAGGFQPRIFEVIRYPIGANPRFPMGTPAQLAIGIERLAAYAREAGRNPAELDIIYRTPDYTLRSNGHAAAGSASRPRFAGTAIEIALDIRQYEALGVGYLVVDFARMSRTLEEMLQHMEAMASQVWP